MMDRETQDLGIFSVTGLGVTVSLVLLSGRVMALDALQQFLCILLLGVCVVPMWGVLDRLEASGEA